MTYFMINGVDFSKYVSKLKVGTENIYNAQTNAAGNTVVDYINSKREIEVEIIPLDSAAMATLQQQLSKFEVNLTFMDPVEGVLISGVKCILPDEEIEYYTIQTNKTMFKALKLKFSEL